jgi:hypothetical protein
MIHNKYGIDGGFFLRVIIWPGSIPLNPLKVKLIIHLILFNYQIIESAHAEIRAKSRADLPGRVDCARLANDRIDARAENDTCPPTLVLKLPLRERYRDSISLTIKTKVY